MLKFSKVVPQLSALLLLPTFALANSPYSYPPMDYPPAYEATPGQPGRSGAEGGAGGAGGRVSYEDHRSYPYAPSSYAPGQPGQPGRGGQGGAGGAGGRSNGPASYPPSAEMMNQNAPRVDEFDYPPEPQSGRPGGQGGRGGVGAGGASGASQMNRPYAMPEVDKTSDSYRSYEAWREQVIRESQGRVVPGEAGQPGGADGSGGAGGKGGVSTTGPAVPSTGKLPTSVNASKPATQKKPSNGKPQSDDKDSGAQALSYACSNGKDYTLLLDPKTKLKSGKNNTELLWAVGFCPQKVAKPESKVTNKDFKACRSSERTRELVDCLAELYDNNKMKQDDRKRPYVASEIKQGREPLSAKNLASLEKSCKVVSGNGEAFKNTGCARTAKIGGSTTEKEFSCLFAKVEDQKFEMSPPSQRTCYRAIEKLRATLIASRSKTNGAPKKTAK